MAFSLSPPQRPVGPFSPCLAPSLIGAAEDFIPNLVGSMFLPCWGQLGLSLMLTEDFSVTWVILTTPPSFQGSAERTAG